MVETSEVDRLVERQKLLRAQQNRLRVLIQETSGEEESGLNGEEVPELRGLTEPDELAANQNLELEEGLRRHRQEIQSLDDQMESLKANMGGLKAKANGLQRQYKLIQTQLARQQALAQEGYYPRNRLLETERQSAEFASELQSTQEAIAAARAEVKSLDAKKQATLAAFREDVSQKLSDVRTQGKEIEKQITAATELLQQRESGLRGRHVGEAHQSDDWWRCSPG